MPISNPALYECDQGGFRFHWEVVVKGNLPNHKKAVKPVSRNNISDCNTAILAVIPIEVS